MDGLRGIAVLLVLWYHVWEISFLRAPFQWLEFIPATGFIGVHLFFFLSGFVITYPFVRASLRGEPGPSWGDFAWRRFAKIVPSYVLSIAVAYAIGYAATQGSGPAWRDILSHLLFVHTWWQQTYGSINGVLWTLAVEVEFYCLYPLVWWCFSRRPIITAGSMVAIAFLWRNATAACCLHGSFEMLEENLPGYLDIFAFGMVSAWAFVRYSKFTQAHPRPWLWPTIAIVGLASMALLMNAMFGDSGANLWSSVWQIDRRPLFGVAFAAIALGLLWSPRWFAGLFATWPLRFLGLISYNLYLYHQMIARELLSWHLPPYRGNPHANPHWGLPYTLGAFVASIGFATLVTLLFERPLMRMLQRCVPRRAPSGHSPSVCERASRERP